MSSPAFRNSIPVLREATFDDYPQLRVLESQNGLACKGYAEWMHLWTGNPVYSSLESHWPIGWVLEHNDRVVGSFGNIPVLYECSGHGITVAAGRAWVVDPVYRSYAPALLDQFLNQNADLCLSTTANLEASRILEALGAKPVPVGAWDRSEIWITNYRGFAKAWLAKRRLPTAFTYVLAPALFLKSSITAKGGVNASQIDVERHTRFDERFDEFWNTLRRERPNSLLAVRTREMLEWHFRHPLEQNRVWILTIARQGSLLAYAIFLEQKNTALDTRQLLLVDFRALHDQDDLLFPILARAVKESQKQNIHLVEKIGLCVGNRRVAVAPYLRKRGSWSYYYKSNNSNLTGLLSNPQVWTPSLFDGDSTL